MASADVQGWADCYLLQTCSRRAPIDHTLTWLWILHCGQYPLGLNADVQVQADGYAMVEEQLPVDCIVVAAGAVHNCRLAVSAKYREGAEMPTIAMRERSGEQHNKEVYSCHVGTRSALQTFQHARQWVLDACTSPCPGIINSHGQPQHLQHLSLCVGRDMRVVLCRVCRRGRPKRSRVFERHCCAGPAGGRPAHGAPAGAHAPQGASYSGLQAAGGPGEPLTYPIKKQKAAMMTAQPPCKHGMGLLSCAPAPLADSRSR